MLLTQMITIQLRAGMGNQMFQYALGKALAKKYNTDLYLDLHFLNDHGIYKKILKEVPRGFDLECLTIDNYHISKQSIHNLLLRPLGEMKNIIGTTYNTIYSHLIKQHVVREKQFHYDQTLHESIHNNSYLIGYWQSYKYFDDIQHELRSEFKPKQPLIKECQELLDRIHQTESVCLNIRRGDYLTDPLFHVQSKEYYEKGINYIQTKINKNLHLFVFSDDITRCKKNLGHFHDNIFFVDRQYAGTKYTHYQELLSHGKHFIGANSSFCWWAIWKNRNPKKIIVLPKLRFKNPDMTTKDMIPAERNTLFL